MRGKGASAVPLPVTVGTPPPPPPYQPGPSPAYAPPMTPTGEQMPPPPAPALSEGGFWGSPAAADGMFQSPPRGWVPPRHGPEGFTQLATARAAQRARYRNRLNVMDLLQCVAAAAVLGSLFMPWYDLGFSTSGVGVSLSISALGSHAGGWRWLILVVATAIIIEGLAGRLANVSETEAWPHAAVQALLGVALLGLVVVAFFTSPLPNLAVYQIPGFGRSAGSGAYLGLVAGVLAAYGGIGRYFVAPPRDLQ